MVDEIPAHAAAYVQIRTALHKIETRTEDGTLLVLKGHLVLEQLIRAKLDAALQDPAQLRKSYLTFFNLLCVARAVFGDVTDDSHGESKSMWDVVEAWNTLRNKLAHRIEPTDTKQLLGRIVYWMPDWKHELETEDAQNALSAVIGMLIARLGELEVAAGAKLQTENKSAR
jgi:hypothetical protein